MGVKIVTEEIADRLALSQLLSLYSRAIDRMDRPLAESCWWPGGTDDHAPLYVGPIEGFWDWVWPVHQQMRLTRHVTSNFVITLQGDRAASESYWTAYMRLPRDGGDVEIHSGGRYIDSFAKRGGEWRFLHRQSIREWGRADPVAAQQLFNITSIIRPQAPEAPLTPQRRDQSDYSYHVLNGSGQ